MENKKSMKTLNEIKQIIRKEKKFLNNQFHVNKIGIFGSYYHRTQSPQSDLDLIVYFNAPIGWEFIELKQYLESKLNLKIDLVTEKALKPQIKESIINAVEFA